MPQFHAEINVMPHKALLDPQGKAVLMGLKNLNITTIEDVRVGKHIQLLIQANDEKEAYQIAETACKNLLHNPIMETYQISIHPVK
ncbi:MAG: phosphoribosylformylglycinamidine synthase subunit PurS [Bacteroidia bacterium]|nr:MAG: phosphoribosylformylglycinamidine synthase subunit PurS [Bacteroidia bacterium]